MSQQIHITSLSTFSALGSNAEDIWISYKNNRHTFSKINSNWVSRLSDDLEKEVELIKSEAKYRSLDRSVLLALVTGRKALQKSEWSGDSNFGINIGSSRGATSLFESYYEDFKSSDKVSPLSSPSTTLGNISSWVAHDLKSRGPVISHSITCSSALHALLNGIAWIKGGLTNKFMVGGAEAPLTAFTISQMKALKIYAKNNSDYPCRSLDFNKQENSMILSEAAGIICIETGPIENSLAEIVGFGYATEPLTHGASLSSNAQCIQDSMSMALGTSDPNEIDAIITHTPGTIKGDLAEFEAIKTVFKGQMPAITSNKWKVGHSLGASGLLSIEMAVLMLEHQQFINVPFLEQKQPSRLNKILVNAVGFGGNAVSILLAKSN